MAINSNVVSHFFHFRPDDDWSIQSKRRQSYFSELKLVTDNLSLFTLNENLAYQLGKCNDVKKVVKVARGASTHSMS